MYLKESTMIRFSDYSKKNIFSILSVILLIFTQISLEQDRSQSVSNFEWRINVGDSQTYIYTKFFDSSLTNPQKQTIGMWNGTPSPLPQNEADWVYITLLKGLSFKVVVTSLEPNEIYCKIIYNGSQIVLNQSLSQFALPTIYNRTYWEEMCASNESMTITGDIITISYSETVYPPIPNNRSIFYNYEWNWKTGWFSVISTKIVSNYSTILSEHEITMITDSNLPLNLAFGSLLLIFIVLTLSIIFTYYKKHS